MILNFADLSKAQSYQVMTHCIIPRPVAWILTRNQNTTFNLAPFSYFQAIGSRPPTVMVSIGNQKDGSKKDTLANLEREEDCVIHIANTTLAEAVNLSAKPLPYNESEIELCDLKTVAMDNWPLPRLQEAPIAFCCQLVNADIVAGMNVVFCEIKSAWLDEAILAPAPMDNTPDLPVPEKLDPLARLGHLSYAPLGNPFELERPR